MRILLITSSARGHAIADVLVRSPQKPTIISIATTENPGIRALAEAQFIEQSLTNFNQILSIAKRTQPDLAIIGPEDPIAAGIADVLEEHGIPTVAPNKNLAQIESSKGFARELLKKHQIDCSPIFKVFTKDNKKTLNKFIEQELWGNYVVKFDSLKGGKGVKVSGEHLESINDGVQYAESCIAECGQVVIEEKLVGCEFSLISFVDGMHVIDCPFVQDHKRAYDRDTGPNTGGMGAYSDANHSLPFLTKSDVERAKEIQRLTVEALKKEGTYKGILYGGYMATHDGVKVIEFNCRFGDPEALNILSILESDFVAICQAITTGELKKDMVRFAKKATVCKYIVPKSYPESKDEVGSEVRLPKPPHPGPPPPGEGMYRDFLSRRSAIEMRGYDDTYKIFFGDISQDPDGTLRLGGSRAIGIVGIGKSIAEAERIAESICKKVEGPVRFRSDIGTKALIQERIDLMRRLRP